MDEIDSGPLSNEELAKGAVKSIVKFMVIKWAVILTIQKLAKRAAKKAAEEKKT